MAFLNPSIVPLVGGKSLGSFETIASFYNLTREYITRFMTNNVTPLNILLLFYKKEL